MRTSVTQFTLSVTLGLALLLPACSKKETTVGNSPVEQPITNAPAAAAPEPTAAVAPQQASETPVILTDVSKAVQNRNYDDAVETLAKLKPLSAQMTDQQRIQYQQALVNTTEALARAKDKDPRAAAAYEKLSRSILGR